MIKIEESIYPGAVFCSGAVVAMTGGAAYGERQDCYQQQGGEPEENG